MAATSSSLPSSSRVRETNSVSSLTGPPIIDRKTAEGWRREKQRWKKKESFPCIYSFVHRSPFVFLPSFVSFDRFFFSLQRGEYLNTAREKRYLEESLDKLRNEKFENLLYGRRRDNLCVIWKRNCSEGFSRYREERKGKGRRSLSNWR